MMNEGKKYLPSYIITLPPHRGGGNLTGGGEILQEWAKKNFALRAQLEILCPSLVKTYGQLVAVVGFSSGNLRLFFLRLTRSKMQKNRFLTMFRREKPNPIC